MTRSTLTRLFCLGALGLAASPVVGQEIYCWKDDDGATHCGDSVPPDQARFDRNIRNEQGIILRFEEGEITPEEQQEILERIQREEAERQAKEEADRYDRLLLDSYETIEDIEARRDRFLQQFQGQIIVAELYLGNLGKRLETLMDRADRYAPYNESPDADQVPANLARDIENTESSITNFTRRLEEIQEEQQRTREQFEKDIARFRELQGTNNA